MFTQPFFSSNLHSLAHIVSDINVRRGDGGSECHELADYYDVKCFMTELSTLASSQLIIIATECAATVHWAATSLFHKLGDGFIFSNIFLSEFKLNPRRRWLRSARMR